MQMDDQMKYLLRNLRDYRPGDIEDMREYSPEDVAMSKVDMVRIGLLAAQRFGVPADAMIIFVARGNRVAVPIPKELREAPDATPPDDGGAPPDCVETESVFDWIEMEIVRMDGLRFAGGYSEAANTLALDLGMRLR